MTDNEIKDYLFFLKPMLTERIKERLNTTPHLTKLYAEKGGIKHEINKVSSMQEEKISDFEKKAELLNILDNRCLQIERLCWMIKSLGVSQNYSYTFGDVSVLRGTYRDAVHAVCLQTEDGKEYRSSDFKMKDEKDAQNSSDKKILGSPGGREHDLQEEEKTGKQTPSDKQIQKDMEELAEKCISNGERPKRYSLANELGKRKEYVGITPATIERRTKVTWKT